MLRFTRNDLLSPVPPGKVRVALSTSIAPSQGNPIVAVDGGEMYDMPSETADYFVSNGMGELFDPTAFLAGWMKRDGVASVKFHKTHNGSLPKALKAEGITQTRGASPKTDA